MIDTHPFRYAGLDINVLTSFDGKRYTAWFEGDKSIFKTAIQRHAAIRKLWDQRRKDDGKRTMQKVPPRMVKKRTMLSAEPVESANDAKPVTLHETKPAIAKERVTPPATNKSNCVNYEPPKVNRFHRGPPTTPRIGS